MGVGMEHSVLLPLVVLALEFLLVLLFFLGAGYLLLVGSAHGYIIELNYPPNKCLVYWHMAWGISAIFAAGQQFYKPMENPKEENHSEESDSKLSINKTHRIKKSPKPNKQPPHTHPLAFDPKQSIFSSLRLTPQFGLFENELQKQLRLQKFWRQEIDVYYKKRIQQHEQELLQSIMEEEVPSLGEVIERPNEFLPPHKAPFEELFRYVDLIRTLQIHSHSLVLVQSQERHYLAVFQGQLLSKMIEVSLEEAYLISKRQSFITRLTERQHEYNRRRGSNEYLSETAVEVAFLLFLMKQNKVRINQEVSKIYERVVVYPKQQVSPVESVEDRYIACLIRKNLRMALNNPEIDYLNYFANLDTLQQYGAIEGESRSITDKKEFEEYIKRKKSKKTRKNTKGVLKTACAGCLSPYHEQYNPFLYCSECHVRFHKYCYSPIEGVCEPCSLKKVPPNKVRAIECQLCQSRGLLSLPTRQMREGVSIHIFCMLINGLWKVEKGALEFKSSNFVARDLHNDLCSLCDSTVYTYACGRCSRRAHPLCAYLGGWNMWLDERESVVLECCTAGLEREKQSYRRKFMLNYRKLLYKTDRER